MNLYEFHIDLSILLPCPFYGGPPEVKCFDNNPTSWVHCTWCGAGIFTNFQSIAEAWNKREKR